MIENQADKLTDSETLIKHLWSYIIELQVDIWHF
jgi:hypothetical protein